jgi:SOS response regulatory protein OraA/RecX
MTPQQIDQEIYNVATAAGFMDQAARYIVAQARYESADYSSNVFRNNNNMYGMKYVAQQLATRGTLAPMSERSAACKYASPADSAQDVINRLYQKTMRGVRPAQLKTASTPEIFADLLKKRGYYGATVEQYARGLRAKLKKVNIIPIQTLPGVTVETPKKKFSTLIITGAALLLFFYYRKKR